MPPSSWKLTRQQNDPHNCLIGCFSARSNELVFTFNIFVNTHVLSDRLGNDVGKTCLALGRLRERAIWFFYIKIVKQKSRKRPEQETA